jgi:hypothetical protein
MILQFDKQLREILEIYKDGSDEPLDADEVERLIQHLKNQLNLIEGNITEEEYLQLESDKK